ncbi:MAG: 4Fe-4S dicluster domain-containing protein [Clostridia bacterium]|nr:4Fe-4S dicluster domain-containing protein [Clostridia bacterium]
MYVITDSKTRRYLWNIASSLTSNHYEKLSLHASDCVKCGHCESRCPFAVPQMTRMDEIAQYFGK